MKIAMIVVRTLMGLLFIFASVVYFLGLIEPPPDIPDAAKRFNEGLTAAPYMLTTVKVIELVCGILLLVGRFVPLAAILLAPIIVNIFLFHLFLDRNGLPVAIFVVAANVFIAYYYRRSYAGLFTAK
jgi:putative oxidoreductase